MNIKIAVVLAFAIFLFAVISFRTGFGLLLVFFTVPFDRLGKLGPESAITVAKILILIVMSVWITKIVLKRDTHFLAVFRVNSIPILSLLFILTSFVCIVNAEDYQILVFQMIRRTSCVILFFIIVGIVQEKGLWRQVLMTILLAYIFVGLTGLYEIYSGQSILQTVWGIDDTELDYTLQSIGFRVRGPGGDPDFHAVSLISPMVLTIALLYWKKSRIVKLAVFMLFAMLLVNLLGTGSRGGLLSFLIGVSSLLFFLPLKRKFLLGSMAALFLVGFIVVFSLVSLNTPTERFSGQAGGKSIQYRIGWTKMAFEILQDHPILGIGTGNFPVVYNRYRIPEVPRKPYLMHNSVLQTWVENGIAGLLVFLSLFFVALKSMARVIRESADPELRLFATYIFGVIVAYFMFAGTSNVLENENYWILFAFSVIVYRFFLEEQKTGSRNGQDRGEEVRGYPG